ncbi:MAG: transaldolase [Chloroflexi bacterium]|nr:transaldolase [Chloroflexota bacterium]
MTKLHQVLEHGQSIWLDHIRRSLLTSGELERLIEQGVRGMTSNPAIFDEAISHSDDYNDQLKQVAGQEHSNQAVYEALAIDDIQHAADLFRPVYDEMMPVDGMVQNSDLDGFVSLEADPHLAHDTQGTIDEIHRLHQQVDRPNVMFKVPATPAGIPAIKQLTSDGININITLMFSVKHYHLVTDAWLSGLEARARRDEPITGIASVASFFVSRIDNKLDPQLESIGMDHLRGTIGVANAKKVYQQFTKVFSSARWKRLARQGVHAQRVLWGSTSTKNPDYPDTMYVDNLIGPQTVNTVPPPTLDAFLDHGTVERTVDRKLTGSLRQLEQLAKANLDLIAVGDELQEEGVKRFADAFDALLESIAHQRETVSAYASD